MTKFTFEDFNLPDPSPHPAVRLRHIFSEAHHNRFVEFESASEFNPELLTLALWLAVAYTCTDRLIEICDQAVNHPPADAVAYIEGLLVSFVVDRVSGIVHSVSQKMA